MGDNVTHLPEAEYLFVSAEIAAAFVGFASVVAILGQRSGRDDASLDTFRVRVMIEAGLLTVFAALLPVLLHRTGFGESIWRVSSALTAATGAAVFVGTVRRFPRGKATRESRSVANFGGILLFVPTLVLVFAAFGVPADAASSYFVALYIYLASAALGLFRVVTSLLSSVPR